MSVIDLDLGEHIAEAHLGAGCAPDIQAERGAKETILVTCGDVALTLRAFTPDAVRLLRVGPDGQMSEIATFPGRRDPNWIKSVLFAVQRSDGTYYAVYNDGAIFDEQGTSATIDPLPEPDSQFGFNTGAMLGQDRYVLASGPRFDHRFTNVMVVDVERPEAHQVHSLPFPAQHVTPVDDHRVAVLHEDGRAIYVLDVETGDIQQALTLDEPVDYLTAG